MSEFYYYRKCKEVVGKKQPAGGPCVKIFVFDLIGEGQTLKI